MFTQAAAALLIALQVSAPVQLSKDTAAAAKYKDIGEYRITTYCQFCNEPAGYQSASGKTLEYGHVATKELPLGSEIAIDGEPFVVTDVCGVDNTIDIFIPSEDGSCHCNILRYDNVMLKTQ